MKEIKLSPVSREIVNSDNQFGFELFRKLEKFEDTSGNVMISPISIALALSMTYNGAADSTREAMERTLRLQGLTREEINQSYKELIEELLYVDPVVSMDIANSIWYRKGLSVEKDFIDNNEQYYNAEVTGLDFGDPDAKDVINRWISDATHGKIESIISGIDQSVVMYLINALYFKGTWKYKFDQSETSVTPFYLEDGSEIEVPMMRKMLILVE